MYMKNKPISQVAWEEMMPNRSMKFLRPCHVGSISCGQSCGWGPPQLGVFRFLFKMKISDFSAAAIQTLWIYKHRQTFRHNRSPNTDTSWGHYEGDVVSHSAMWKIQFALLSGQEVTARAQAFSMAHSCFLRALHFSASSLRYMQSQRRS